MFIKFIVLMINENIEEGNEGFAKHSSIQAPSEPALWVKYTRSALKARFLVKYLQ